MYSEPLVSVLMTAHNAEEYIGQAITSVLIQTFEKFEFFILDDGSTDKTWDIIQGFAIKDKRIHPLKNESNLGITASRNKLVNQAKGEYIIWHDADDISLPSRIADQYDFMELHNEVGICGGWLKFFNDQGYFSIRKYAADDKTLRKTIFRYSPVAQPAAIIRKTALLQAGNYQKKFEGTEDLDMSFRIGQNFRFANLQKVVLKYRQHSSITLNKLKQLEKQTLKIRYHFAKDKNYHFGVLDSLYNISQFLTIYLLPAKLRIGLFNLIRNSKK